MELLDPSDETGAGRDHEAESIDHGDHVRVRANAEGQLAAITSSPALLIDGSQRITSANSAAVALLGRPPDEIVGSRCNALIHARYDGGAPVCRPNCAAIQCLAEGKSYSAGECVVVRSDGSSVRVAMNTHALIGDRNNPARPLGLVTLTEIDKHENGDDAAVELSEREAATIKLIALGYSIKSIGRKLGISPKTVEHHRTTAGKKLGISNRVDIVRYAIRKGWVSEFDDGPDAG